MPRFYPIPPELEDFPTFANYLWGWLNLPGLTTQQIRVADRMQSDDDRDIICAFRGLGKSWLGAARGLHRLRIDPDQKILLVSASMSKASEISSFMLKCLYEVPELNCLIPTDKQRSSSIAFDVGPAEPDQSPSVRAAGILGQITGSRANWILGDDVETLANCLTAANRAKIAHAVSEFESILKPPSHLTTLSEKILYLGTPHLSDSIYGKLVRERNYRICFLPARYPKEMLPYAGNLMPQLAAEMARDPSLVGKPTDPERFGEQDLLARQMRLAKTTWQLQFMVDCTLATSDQYPLRLGDLVVCDLNPQHLPGVVIYSRAKDAQLPLPCPGFSHDSSYYGPSFLGHYVPRAETWRCVMGIDPSGRGKDELAWAVVAELNGLLFLLAAGGDTAGYEDYVLQKIAAICAEYQVNEVLAESNFGDGMFTRLLMPVLRKVHPCRVSEVRSNARKELRMVETLAPLIQQHRLIVSEAVIDDDWKSSQKDPEMGPLRSLFFQISRLSEETGCLEFDDRIDALEIACNYFRDAAAQDAQKKAEEREDELLEQFIRDWGEEHQVMNADRLALGFSLAQSRKAAAGDRSKPSKDLRKQWLEFK